MLTQINGIEFEVRGGYPGCYSVSAEGGYDIEVTESLVPYMDGGLRGETQFFVKCFSVPAASEEVLDGAVEAVEQYQKIFEW